MQIKNIDNTSYDITVNNNLSAFDVKEYYISHNINVSNNLFDKNISKENNYKIICIPICVTGSYIPKINIILNTTNLENNFENTSVCSVFLDRSFLCYEKQFHGQICVWLNDSKIQVIINGDFYNNGETQTENIFCNINNNESHCFSYIVNGKKHLSFYENYYKYFEINFST